MAAKLSPRVQHLVTEAAELLPDELAELVSAIQSLPGRPLTRTDRRAEIAARVARAQSGDVATLSIEDVERSIRDDLDF